MTGLPILATFIGLWLIVPIIVFVSLDRLTEPMADRGGLMRYLIVCLLPPLTIGLVLQAIGEPQIDQNMHVSSGMLFAGIPAFLYFVVSNIVWWVRLMLGKTE